MIVTFILYPFFFFSFFLFIVVRLQHPKIITMVVQDRETDLFLEALSDALEAAKGISASNIELGDYDDEIIDTTTSVA